MGRNLQKLALWGAPLVFVAVLFYWAIGNLLALGLKQNWPDLFTNGRFQQVVAFTLGQAALSTILCLIFGLPGAYVIYRKKFFGQNLVKAFIAVPFVLPTIVIAIALQNFTNWLPSFVVILIAHLFLNYSIVVRTVGGVWQSLDREIENAAELDGAKQWQIFWRITLPILRPAVVSATVLVFLYCVTSFGIILLLGGGRIATIETEIYFSLTQFLDFKTAAALSVVQSIVTVSVFAISKALGSSVAGLEPTTESQNSERIRIRDWPVVLVTACFVTLVLAWPMAQVITRFTWQGFADLGSNGSRDLLNISVWQAAANSGRNIVIAAGLAMLIGVLVSWLLNRSRKSWLELPFLVPMGVSSVVLGFGYLLTFQAGWLTIPLVQAVLATPLVIRIVHPALVALSPSYREEAVTAGANSWQIWRLVEAPLVSNAMRAALVFASLVSLGEFGAASLLSYGDQATLPIVLYQLISRPGAQNYAMAMAICALLIIFVFSISIASALIQKRRRFA